LYRRLSDLLISNPKATPTPIKPGLPVLAKIRASTATLYSTSSLGFKDDEKRNAAFKKWHEHLASKNKQEKK